MDPPRWESLVKYRVPRPSRLPETVNNTLLQANNSPKILILLGSTAMNALIGNEVVISKVRGQWIEKKFGQCKTSVIVTFHPAFLMRQPTQKKLAWIDLKMIRDKKAKLKI